MAAPFQDPRTGIFYFRRVIPAALRPFFDGAASEYKRTLDTRDPEEARQRYHPHAVVYDQKLASAKRALASGHLRSARVMVDAYLNGSSDLQLQGIAQKLASLELGAFKHAHGLTDYDPGGRYNFGTPPAADDLRDHGDRKAMLEAIPDFSPLPWLETLQRISNLTNLHPIDWAITTIAYSNGIASPMEPALYEAIGRAFLDRLCKACALRIDPARTRIMPSPILITGIETAPSEAQPHQIPSKADAPTIMQVFDDWAVFQPREAKLVDEWRMAIARFARLHGDPPVDTITASMVRNFRRTCAALPSRAGKAMAALPLLEQVELANAQGLQTLSPATVNKALSAIRVTLDHAVEELEVISENVAKTVKSLAKNTMEDARLPFEPQDLVKIFTADIPEKGGVSSSTFAWTLLLAPFTGCRLEELGKLRPGNVRTFDGIPYIAIELDRIRLRKEQNGPAKRMKTSSAKRDIPLHPILIKAGFLDLVAKRRDEGAEWLRAEGIIKSKGLAHFRTWTVETGPTEWTNASVWEEIDAHLVLSEVSKAAGMLRRFLEYYAAEACHRLRAPVEFRGDAQFMLGDTMPAAIGEFGKLLKKAKDVANSWGQSEIVAAIVAREADFTAAKQATNVDQWQVNTSVHYNSWADLGKGDFAPVVTAFRALVSSFECSTCEQMYSVTPERGPKGSVRCRCGELNLNLVAK